MQQFDHERLDVYQAALQFVVVADEIIEQLPKGSAHVSNQLHRASLSIVLNIAEGAGEFSRKAKASFYRIAARSATECAGVLDVCRVRKFAEEIRLNKRKELLVRVVSMLTRMVQGLRRKRRGGSGTGTGTGTGTE